MLHVHHADHADTLVAGLARVLTDPLPDVFAVERVGVHSRGLERWLAQRLSHHLGATDGRDDGICAAVDFPFPGRLLADVLAAAAGMASDTDPWQADRLPWPLLALLEERPALAAGTPLAGHLRGDGDVPADGRFAAVRTVADLFDRYAIHRPAMLRRWAAGEAADPVLADGRPLPPGGIWQATLWRALRDHLDVPNPAERFDTAVARLAVDPDCCDLPPRFSLFGLTALPASYLVVLRALAVHRDVHLFLLHPSPALWDRVERHLARRPVATLPRRDDDPVRALVTNPLLRAWGRDAREMQVVMQATGSGPDGETTTSTVPSSVSTTVPPTVSSSALPTVVPAAASPTSRTVLARLQADVRGDVAPPGPPGPGQFEQRPVLADGDRSIQVHACHGRSRQVDVLRDVLLHAFAADPTLEPRDVLVLCPDIEPFAPLIEAVFAADPPAASGAGDGAARLRPSALRVRIADRSLRRTNPLLRFVGDVLTLADGRLAASQIRDLIGRAPVRARFDLDDEDLQRLDTWIRDLGVRWGLDHGHRSAYGVATELNTWRTGLARLLVGVAMADEDQRTVGDVVPYDDVAGSDVELAGRFAELLARVEDAVRRLAHPRTIRAWREVLDEIVDGLTDTGDDAWQRVQLASLLDEVVTTAGDHADTLGLSLPEFRELLANRLQGAPGRASHRTGDLTVCTLVPMRSVPHRIVVLLGMDDGAFPRRATPDGDDLLEHDPRIGDRDPRTEDRQLLLDALLATERQLVVIYSGRDERTNDPRPAAVPIGELLDTVDRTVRGGGSDTDADMPASRSLTVEHPLHPFDPRNFTPGALGLPDRSLGSDPADLGGARAIAGADRRPPASLLPDPILDPEGARFPPPDERVIELDDLIRTVTEPIPALLAARLGLRFSRSGPVLDDELTVELDGLAGWAVGSRCLQDRLAGRDPERTQLLEQLRGNLPPGQLAVPVLDEVTGTVDAILALAATLGATGADVAPVEIDLHLADGRRIIGVVDGLTVPPAEVGGDDPVLLRTLTYSRLKERDRLRAWVRLLAATAAHPERAWQAVTVAKGRKGVKVDGQQVQASAAILAPLADDPRARAERAIAMIHRLVDLHDQALTRPVPLMTATSAAYAEAVVQSRHGSRRSPLVQARNRWASSLFSTGEDALPAHVHVFGPDRDLDQLVAVAAGEDQTGPGWDTTEPSRFGRWALRLWDPLLTHERVEDR